MGLLLLGVGLPAAAQTPTNLESLELRDGVYVVPATGKPFDGEVVGMWNERVVRQHGTLRAGRWEGVREWFDVNRQLAARESYRNGVLHGPAEAYFKTGQLSARENYRNGALDGPYESYWVRGRLAERGAWASGEPCGEWLSFGRTLRYPACPA